MPDKELSVDKYSFALILKKIIYVYVPACLYMHHVHEVPMEARGHQIPLELSYRKFEMPYVGVDCWAISLIFLLHFE